MRVKENNSMDLKELQNLIQQEKGKVIIVENGEPIMVILPYQDYKKQGKKAEEPLPAAPLPEPLEAQESDDELTIDDLPL